MSSQGIQRTLSVERFKAYVDAVVAIAMTLLILPLMESVSEAATHQQTDPDFTALDFLGDHLGQIVSFAMSFVLIAVAWMGHHRMYDTVEMITPILLWLNFVWMFAIVCLPVATAMVGEMRVDPTVVAIYVGLLMLTQIASLLARMYFVRHPSIIDAPLARVWAGISADIASLILFAIAGLAAATFLGVGYYAMLGLMLTRPLAGLIRRILRPLESRSSA